MARPAAVGRSYDEMFLSATIPLVRIAAVIGMCLGGLAELGLIVGLAGDAGVDCGEQRVDVRDQLFGDRIGGQLGGSRS